MRQGWIDPLRLEHRNRSGHNSVLFTRRVAGSAMNAQKASTLLEKAAQALRGHGLMVSVQKQDGSEEGRWRSAPAPDHGSCHEAGCPPVA
jgi:hypothetical protein